MKEIYKIILLVVAVQLLVPVLHAQNYQTVLNTVNITAGPASAPKQICVKSREVLVGGINILNLRTGQYAFTGEQIKFNVTVRDPNGWINIGSVQVFGPDPTGVVCTQMSNIPNCDGLGNFNSATDRSYQCILTVQPSWYLNSKVKISVLDVSGMSFVNSTHEEVWDFNPQISMSLSTSDNQPIRFKPANPGEWAESENYVVLKNTAEAGVNLWVWIAGQGPGLTSTSSVSICPTTNVLEWHRDVAPSGNIQVANNDPDTGIAYRAVSGTLQTPWLWMRKYDPNAGCNLFNCFDGMPVPTDAPMQNILTNQGTANIYFKIHYPSPCVGTFDQGGILIIARPV
ncbi:MAG: hypothetical protein KQA41_04265 [Candidatus Aenigmarchaeota archaeon]|nr:hypothetical protein [Candidatus Aenigmarchaeota archaeon]